jgi:peptidyl-tRNA hydrolase
VIEMAKHVQYIIVRKDLVSVMGIGKTAAQVAHASLGAVLDKGQLLDTPEVRGWLAGPFTKLVVYVRTKQKLLNLADKLDGLGIRNKRIYDACRTKLEPEESDGSTLTCVGVAPILADDTPKCLKTLRLLEGDDDGDD